MNVRIYIRNEKNQPELITEMVFPKKVHKNGIISRINKEGVLVGEHTYYPPQSIFKVTFEEGQ